MVQRSLRFRKRSHLAVNALCVAFQFQDATLLSIIVPAIVLHMAPRTHVATFAALATISMAVATVTPTAAGWHSDRRQRRSGASRRVQTAAVLGLDVLALSAIAITHSLPVLTVAIAVAAFALASAGTIYQAILPEVVPRPLWGVSTGVRGAFTLLGATIGLVAASALPTSIAVFVNVVLLAVSAFTLIGIPPRLDVANPSLQDSTVRNRRDLLVTMVMRGFMVLGMGLFSTYILFFFSDVLHVANAPMRTGLTAIAALAGAVVSSVLSGIASDRVDRRFIVIAGGTIMAAASLGFALVPAAYLLFAYAGLFGIGLGAVFAVGFALALDAVPGVANVGRDLGVWTTVSGIPAVFAPSIGAAVLARYGSGAGGYRVLFIVASLSFALGAVTTLLVRNPRAKPG
jgi:MFS family permease